MNWDLVDTWDLVLPPSRPSTEQLKRIRVVADGINRQKPVAILGSTPEFRDVLCQMGFESIYIFDNNQAFYKKMTNLMVSDTTKEKLIVGDWLNTIEDWQETFALILSDLTMGNISYECREKFYKDINNALLPEGVFLDKILTHETFLDAQQLIEEYRDMPMNLWTANRFNCQMLFCSNLLEQREMVDTACFYSFLQESVNENWMTKLVLLTKRITPAGGIWYYGRKRKYVEKDFMNALILKNKWSEPEISPYYKFCYHYLFEKK